MMSSLARAHGALMCISFIFMTEASETVAWWASNKSNTWINYFEKLENGPMLKNTFKRLDAGAVILSMIAFIIVLTTTSFSKAASNSERHLIYGIAALLYCYTHVMVRLYLPENKTVKVVQQWLGPLFNLFCFLVAWTGFELSGYGSNESAHQYQRSTRDGKAGAAFVTAMFIIWYGAKLSIWGYYFVRRKCGRAQIIDTAIAKDSLPTVQAAPA